MQIEFESQQQDPRGENELAMQHHYIFNEGGTVAVKREVAAITRVRANDQSS